MAQIRPATFDDLEFLVGNNLAMALETEGRQLDADTLRAGLSHVLSDPSKGFYIIAEFEGVAVGNLMVTVEWSDWRNAPMWWFQSVYVRPEARAKGVFAQMYAYVHARAKDEGVKELRLYVEKENTRAQRVYTALGMQESHYVMFEVGL